MIIGLTGPAGCGKNAVGAALSSLFGFAQASFARAVREEVARISLYRERIPADIVADPALEELAQTLLKVRSVDPWQKPTSQDMRRALQLWGTEYRRAQDEDYWVKRVTLAPGRDTAITDARFTNEFAICDYVWYVDRAEVLDVPSHASERTSPPPECTHIIDNNGTLEDLTEIVFDAGFRLGLFDKYRLAS